MVQLFTDPWRHNAQRYRQTDRQTYDSVMPRVDHNIVVPHVQSTLYDFNALYYVNALYVF